MTSRVVVVIDRTTLWIRCLMLIVQIMHSAVVREER
jgi:hypothetical protein